MSTSFLASIHWKSFPWFCECTNADEVYSTTNCQSLNAKEISLCTTLQQQKTIQFFNQGIFLFPVLDIWTLAFVPSPWIQKNFERKKNQNFKNIIIFFFKFHRNRILERWQSLSFGLSPWIIPSRDNTFRSVLFHRTVKSPCPFSFFNVCLKCVGIKHMHVPL